MTRQFPELFQKRSATNDFLFSSSDAAGKRDGGTFEPDTCERQDEPLSARFSGMLNRQGLIAAIDTNMRSIAQLCVLVIRIDIPPPKASEKSPVNPEVVADALEPLVAACSVRGGIWAPVGSCRFAFVFPHIAGREGRMLARQMQDALSADAGTLLTAGVAFYPTVNDSRSQVVSNAEKALAHAAFFGTGSITDFDAVSLNISGDRLYQTGDIQGAIDEFKKGLRIDPTDTNLLNSLGVCYGVLKDYHKALTTFETAIWLAPEEIMPVYNQGFVFLRQNKTEQALDCFLAADELESGIYEVVFHVGQIHMDAGEADKARPYLEAATRANHRSGPAYRLLGACLEQLGLTKEAIQAYKAVVKINPTDAASLSILGRLYVQRGESLDVALVFCEQSVQIAPDNGLFRYRLGRVHLEQGRLDTALAEFELATSLGYDSQAMIEETRDRMMASKAS